LPITNFDQISLDKETKLVTANAVASVGVPTKPEFDAVVALVNEIKVKLNTIFKV
jgi:hypothetical protein